MRHSLANEGKLLLCGNGGSAADADHWAGELLKGFCSKRPLMPDEKVGLPPILAEQLQRPLPAIPLTSFTALATAFANDVAPELCFAQLTWALGNAGDVFIGISTSGNAKNVGWAAQAARSRGLRTIGLTGKSGGELKNHCEVMVRVPAMETYLVQELHLPIYHCLSLMLEEEFFK
jgi:D-sedoheptulose 7-phosphate isomerase